MATIILIVVTCLVSILCFTGRLNANKLLFNMLTLLFFGRVVEQYFALAFGSKLGIVLYIVLYVSAMAISTVWDLLKYKDDWNYSAVGASGAVSATPPISGVPSTASSSRWPAARISSGTSLCSWGFDLQPGGITSTLQGHDYRT